MRPERRQAGRNRHVGPRLLTVSLLAVYLIGAGLIGRPASAAEPVLRVSSYPLQPALAPGSTHMGVRLLGALHVEQGRIDGLEVDELSGLAWDDDAGLLYAISDRGRLFHLRPVLQDGILTGLEPVRAMRLVDLDGRPVRGLRADAEGLAITDERNGDPDDARLLISFERAPRVVGYTPHGQPLESLALPPPLEDPRAYASPNRSLESVAVHPRLGVLVAPERPLRGGEDMVLEVRGLTGGAWRHRLHWTLNDAVVALEALPDGSVLILERGHGLMYLPVVITVQHAREPEPTARALEAREVAVFDTSKGWNVDNFEGLARHRDMRFFMVSDDNASSLQRTLLVYFEVLQ
jgi:hypothetical protein